MILNKAFHSEFSVIQSNVETIKEAQVVGLVDYHYEEIFKIKNSWLIKNEAPKNSVLLVECSLNPVPKEFNQSSYLADYIEIIGWDDQKSKKEVEDKINQIDELKKLIIKENVYNIKLLEHIHNLIENLPSSPQKLDLERLFKELSTIDNSTERFEILKKILSYMKKSWFNLVVFPKITSVHLPRNQSLVNCIENCLNQDKKVFVIAGGAHYYDDQGYDTEEQKQQLMEGIAYLQDYLQTKKFIVLQPTLEKKSLNKMEKLLGVNNLKTDNSCDSSNVFNKKSIKIMGLKILSQIVKNFKS